MKANPFGVWCRLHLFIDEKKIMSKKNAEYFMEHPLDIWRLERKVNPEDFVNKYIRTHLENTNHMLEIGCGPGMISAYIGDNFNTINLDVVDKSLNKIKTTREKTKTYKNINVAVADIYDLPFNSNSYDFIFCRLLFQYLKEPQKAVDEMVRVCKKGGMIMVQDLDGQMLTHFPVKACLQKQIEKIGKMIADNQGFDPYVGRKLYSFFKQAGLKDIDIEIDKYHNIYGTIDAKNLSLWEAKMEIAEPEIARAMGSKNKAKKLIKDYIDYLKDDNTITFSIMFTAYGKKS
jgi:ubiquinone/menaquinone biosynthesis C-methylase UbiE